jgi:N-acetylglucosamine-6-sulfatase
MCAVRVLELHRCRPNTVRTRLIDQRAMTQRLAAAILVLAMFFGTLAPTEFVTTATQENRPNFVVIVVDDLDISSVAYMPAVQRHLGDAGMFFSRFFATTPLCCPSRASILRGQYAHNHRVLRNTGESAGFSAFRESGHEESSMGPLLDAGGYETALVGKYLNGYSLPGNRRNYVPTGWDHWVAGVDHEAYAGYDYDLNVDGEIVHHGSTERDYLTDVLAGHALAFLDRQVPNSDPFLLYLAPYAPHNPATPAPRHLGAFHGSTAPRGPSFNERNIRDKPAWVRSIGRLSQTRIDRIDADFARRLESLQAVDETIDGVMQRLADLGLLESTYVLFLSDNGYFLGEHRQPHGKDAPYDAASRVPFIVLGPDIAADSTSERMALNIDILPTVLDLAGLETPQFIDGRSLRPLLEGNAQGWRKAALLEGFGKETESIEGSESATPAFRALRLEQTLYVEYETGERELYNLRSDPFELTNVVRDAPRALLRSYARHVKRLSSCSASSCRQWEDLSPRTRTRNRSTEPNEQSGTLSPG